MKVCEKVEQKVRTTYNEVADELVAEFAGNPEGLGFGGDDEKGRKSAGSTGGEAGIRRRVYDALNVLMAMDIITKEKKNILWRGLPTNTEQARANEGARLQMDLSSREERMGRKRQHLQDLVSQQVSFKQLISRNRTPEYAAATPPESRIALPFIVVNTRKETVIDCEMAEDRQEIFFNFSAPFEIHDDSETLKRMDMQRCRPEQIATLLPDGLVRHRGPPHLTRRRRPPPRRRAAAPRAPAAPSAPQPALSRPALTTCPPPCLSPPVHGRRRLRRRCWRSRMRSRRPHSAAVGEAPRRPAAAPRRRRRVCMSVCRVRVVDGACGCALLVAFGAEQGRARRGFSGRA